MNYLSSMSQIDLKIFNKEKLEETNNYIILRYFLTSDFISILEENIFTYIDIYKPKIDYEINDKINNTGNIQIWPSEEILAFYILSNYKKFENKCIIELGSGFSGLGSLIIGKFIKYKKIKVTDGNKRCVESITRNIKLNNILIDSELLVWDKYSIYNEDYDIIIISDCLFFKNYHIDLIYTIKSNLKDDGICIIISPPRGDSMELFLKEASSFFNVSIKKEELNFIDFDVNGFNPYFIEMSKI